MRTDEAELRRHLAAAAAAAGTPRFTAKDVAVRVWRVRRRRARIGAGASAAAVVAAAAVALPLGLGGTAPGGSLPAGRHPPGMIAGPVPPGPPLELTVTVNGQPLAVPESLADGPTGWPQYDLAPGERVTITMTVTVPAHAQLVKFFMGITGDSSGIGPRGPIGMKPVLGTVAQLGPGTHALTGHWTVPAGTPPPLFYELSVAAYWSKATTSEPNEEEVPIADFGVKPGVPVPPGAAARLQALALGAAKDDGDAKPEWSVAVRTTFAKALAAVGQGDSMPTVSPGTPVYLVVTKGNFTIHAGPAGAAVTGQYLSAIVDAKTFDGYEDGLSTQAPSVPLDSLGPLASLAGGQPVQ